MPHKYKKKKSFQTHQMSNFRSSLAINIVVIKIVIETPMVRSTFWFHCATATGQELSLINKINIKV